MQDSGNVPTGDKTAQPQLLCTLGGSPEPPMSLPSRCPGHAYVPHAHPLNPRARFLHWPLGRVARPLSQTPANPHPHARRNPHPPPRARPPRPPRSQAAGAASPTLWQAAKSRPQSFVSPAQILNPSRDSAGSGRNSVTPVPLWPRRHIEDHPSTETYTRTHTHIHTRPPSPDPLSAVPPPPGRCASSAPAPAPSACWCRPPCRASRRCG